ncbi:uncharacterized protein LOC131937397 [Physella acuta]|uniref:uncharacterized protein LOC131937397 n=1 Tax=Physella acuta TaxID=109671 RepID=UPI0027DC25E3|nr:uncharacterized protein LOC131937397 [Physella acuta]XP_059150776.1 uncharacterized protein LOC131937397 [Physella acuta]
MSIYWLTLVCVMSLVCVTSLVGARTPVEVMNDVCNKQVTVKGSLLLRQSFVQNQDCEVTLVTSEGAGLVAQFTHYTQQNHGAALVGLITECTLEYVQLVSEGGDKLMGSGGYCKSLRPTQQYDLGGRATFMYHRSETSLVRYLSFDLLVTEVYSKKGHEEGCAERQFDCGEVCISQQLTCDGYDNCGNEDDENDDCGLSKIAIIGIVAGVAAFVALVISIVIYVVRRKRYVKVPQNKPQ